MNVIPSLLWPMNRVSDALPLKGVHLWAWSLVRASFDLASEARLLSPVELGRLRRFRFEADRVRFAISHATLRRIVSGYLACAPDELLFSTNPYGRPYLAKPATQLSFNLSHVSLNGADRLHVHAEFGGAGEPEDGDVRGVAQTHFSSRELADLDSLSGPLWLEGFYNCWTRKEAILKAEGLGLNPPLAAFDVSLLPGSPPQLLNSLPSSRLTRDWKLVHLVPSHNTVGALAISSEPSLLSCYTFWS